MTHNKQQLKEPIRLRTKKLRNGGESLYLDRYANGTRTYEFLKLYLLPGNNPAAKRQNAATLQTANTIKAQRIISLAKTSNHTAIWLSEWLRQLLADDLRKGKKTERQYRYLATLLKRYKPTDTLLQEIDTAFCSGFLDFLKQTRNGKTKIPKPLSENSCHNYYKRFNCALNAAVRAGHIASNPFASIAADNKPKIVESPKTYLTPDELRRLIGTECKNADVKRAFLFSCFCGLRISDVRALEWSQIIQNGQRTSIELVMQKNKRPIYVKLSDEAKRWLPANAATRGKVFLLPASPTVNHQLQTWAERAQISRHVTFHTARHTFATLLLTMGADLYTTSKLLGHSDIKTTQIYAKIVDKKKDEAIDLLNHVFD